MWRAQDFSSARRKITLHNCSLSKYRLRTSELQISWPNAQWRMPEKKRERRRRKGILMFYLSKHCVQRKTENLRKEKNSMRGIIFATGTKDKMDPSTSATTNCQLRIRWSRQACLNKPVNMALLTSRNGAPCQAKCCLLLSQVTVNWFYTAKQYFVRRSGFRETQRFNIPRGRRDSIQPFPAQLQQSRWTWEIHPPRPPRLLAGGSTPQTLAFKWHWRW